jgi:uncharacterized OB-fold protein
MTSNPAVSVPAPVVTPENARFWEGVKAGQFLLAECTGCGARSLDEEACVRCGANDRQWLPASGRGRLKSYVVFQRAYNDYWATQVPYNVCVVALDEGPELLTNVVDVSADELEVGMQLEVVLRPRGEHVAPVARPSY